MEAILKLYANLYTWKSNHLFGEHFHIQSFVHFLCNFMDKSIYAFFFFITEFVETFKKLY